MVTGLGVGPVGEPLKDVHQLSILSSLYRPVCISFLGFL